MTDEELLSKWLASRASGRRGMSADRLDQYRIAIHRAAWYAATVLGKPLHKWGKFDMGGFLAYLPKVPAEHIRSQAEVVGLKFGDAKWTPFRKKPGPVTCIETHRAVRSFFEWAHTERYLAANPAAEYSVAKRPPPAASAKVLPPELCTLILRAIDRIPAADERQARRVGRARFSFICLARTGLRPAELRQAKMSQIQERSAMAGIKAARHWVIVVGSGAKAREVPFDACLADLARYRALFGASQAPSKSDDSTLLLALRGKDFSAPEAQVSSKTMLRTEMTWLLKEVATVLRAQGLSAEAAQVVQATPMWLRHTFAKAILPHAGLARTAAILGADPSTTMTYAQGDAAGDAQAVRGHLPV